MSQENPTLLISQADQSRIEYLALVVGWTEKELAKQFHYSADLITFFLSSRNIETPDVRTLHQKEERKERVHLPMGKIILEYLSGKSMQSLADDYGVTKTTIDKRLTKAKVEKRSRGGAFPPKK